MIRPRNRGSNKHPLPGAATLRPPVDPLPMKPAPKLIDSRGHTTIDVGAMPIGQTITVQRVGGTPAKPPKPKPVHQRPPVGSSKEIRWGVDMVRGFFHVQTADGIKTFEATGQSEIGVCHKLHKQWTDYLAKQGEQPS